MATLSDKASTVLNDLLGEFEDPHEIMEEYEHHGICISCGHLQHGVEPDAEGYLCQQCEQEKVMGLETAFMYLW